MSRFTRVFLYSIYFVGVVGLSTLIALSFRSGQASAPAVSVRSSSSRTSNQAASSKTEAATPAQSNASQLADTGPGNPAGLFVIACICGAAVYRRFAIRRLSN